MSCQILPIHDVYKLVPYCRLHPPDIEEMTVHSWFNLFMLALLTDKIQLSEYQIVFNLFLTLLVEFG